MLYADIAARPGLAWRSALVSAAVAGALLGAATGLDWPLLWLVPLTPVAVALSVIDWHTRLLPRVVVVPVTLAAIVVVTAVGLATGERDALVRALRRDGRWPARSSGCCGSCGRPGMGFGDVRLAAPVGLVLGWTGLGRAGDRALGRLHAVRRPGARRARWRGATAALLKKSFPFGPFMVGGALVGLVWGTALAGRIWG